MPKKVPELSDLQVRRQVRPGLHAVGGVTGLHLQVTPAGVRSWVLRITVGTKRRDMGLGGYPDVPLARAREKAREARALVEKGIDPILQRQQARSALAAQRAATRTFAECVHAFLEAKSPEWSNAKHAQQWQNTLDAYAMPKIGRMVVADIGTAQVLEVLRPIWTAKTETATRVRGRIEAVLDWATVHQYRIGPNPARWRGHLDALLANPAKFKKVEHHAALPVDELPAFIVRLRAAQGTGARALEFAILTAARSGEVRLARWDELDVEAGVWTIPAERMKAGREHRVPLSSPALELLKGLQRNPEVPLVFPSTQKKPLSDMTLTAVLRRMNVAAVPHGFRSTFKDWASERTHYANELSEMALAHMVESKTEAAYRRGDLLDKRRQMMKDWASFCEQQMRSSSVIPLRRGQP